MEACARKYQKCGHGNPKAMRQIEKANPDTLFVIFGDAQWTNKDRLSDETLINLLEHFSSQTLSIKNVPNDELGQGYEFLIKKFADDSGHTAARILYQSHRGAVDDLDYGPKTG